MYDLFLSPGSIGGLELKNRVIFRPWVPAMWKMTA